MEKNIRDISRFTMSQIADKKLRMMCIRKQVEDIQNFIVPIHNRLIEKGISFTFSRPLEYGLSIHEMLEELKKVYRENNLDITPYLPQEDKQR